MENSLFLILGAGITYALLCAIWYVLCVIGGWKVFTKAGEAGWKSIIPFYNTYIYFKISWKPVMFWVMVILMIAGTYFSRSEDSSMVGHLCAFGSAILTVIQNVKLSKAFGHGIFYALGLLIFNPVFVVLLGFGGSRYHGPQK